MWSTDLGLDQGPVFPFLLFILPRVFPPSIRLLARRQVLGYRDEEGRDIPALGDLSEPQSPYLKNGHNTS